jgi:uncharacterized protein (DUF934 family)
MSVIVTDTGFLPDDWRGGFVPLASLPLRPCGTGLGVEVPSTADPGSLAQHLPRVGLLRIRLEHFLDRRAFDLARRVRAQGFRGRLRAAGPMLACHYTLARRSGFDEVEISADLALRQPAEHWRFRGHWRHGRFGSRMPAQAEA